MSNFPFYENIILNSALPVQIHKHYNDSSGTGCAFHWHEAIEIYYVRSGGLDLNCRGTVEHLVRGDIGLVGWGQPHRGLGFENNTLHYILQIDLSKSVHLSKYEQLQMPDMLFKTSVRKDIYLANLLDSIISEYDKKDIGFELNVIAGFYNFFAHIMRKYMPPKNTASLAKNLQSLKHVHEILKQLNKNYKQISSLEELAKKLGLSKEYMCRIFKKHTGNTIFAHLNEQRCHYAASLILEGRPLSEVSELAGFNDYNYFSRIFKRIMNASPSEYSKKDV